VRTPKAHGSLRIIDPRLINLSLGDNILWRMVIEKYEQRKKVFVKKYFVGHEKRCLDVLPSTINGSLIWKLVNVAIPIIQIDLTWVPSNGGLIDISNNNIMWNKPLVHAYQLAPL
jgi:hypothetical protein